MTCLIIVFAILFSKVDAKEFAKIKSDNDGVTETTSRSKGLVHNNSDGYTNDDDHVTKTVTDGKSRLDDTVTDTPGIISVFPFLGVDITCSLDQLCVSPTRDVSYPKCYCDNECAVFGDCCADWYTTTHNNESDIIEIMDHPYHWYGQSAKNVEHFQAVSEFMRASSCQPMVNDTIHTAIRVVTTCPDGYGDIALRRRCEIGEFHPVYNVPVSLRVAGSVQIVYKSSHCAKCHGTKLTDIRYWEVKAKCPDDIQPKSNDIQKTLKEHCSFNMIPPSNLGNIRYCHSDVRRSYADCSGSTDNVSDAFGTICRSYVGPIFSRATGDKYANPHCAVCSLGFNYNPFCHWFTGISNGEPHERTGINMLFNFNPKTGSWYSSKEEYCGETTVKYPYKHGCNALLCPRNTRPSYGKCIDDEFAIYNQSGNIPYDEEGERDYNVIISIHIVDRGHNESFIRHSAFLQRMNESSIAVHTDFQLINTSSLTSFTEYRQEYRVNISEQDTVSFGEVLGAIVQEIHHLQRDINITLSVKVTNFVEYESLHCKDTDLTRLKVSAEMVFSGDPVSFIRPNGSDISINIRYTRFVVSLDSTGHPTITFVAFCKENIPLDCSLLSYTKNEYNIKETRAYIKHWEDSVDNFVIEDGILYVCDPSDIPVDDTMQTVTVVMLSVSLVSLLALLIVHCSFPSLQTSHGKNLMAFSTSLFISQSLFLAGSYAHGVFEVCVTVAVMQHYFWLCTFMWNSVMAYDFASKFSALTMMTSAAKYTKYPFKKYFLLAHGLPLLLVVTCVVLDNTNIPGVDIQYNANADYCWIGNYMASVYAFMIPVGVCLLFNMICFGIAMHGIQGTKNVTKNVRIKKQDKNYCIIYTKISLLLGSTWIIGFVSASINFKPLAYINICLNGLQGFFIFLGFVVNSRVMGLIRQEKVSMSSAKSVKSSEMTNISRA